MSKSGIKKNKSVSRLVESAVVLDLLTIGLFLASYHQSEAINGLLVSFYVRWDKEDNE